MWNRSNIIDFFFFAVEVLAGDYKKGFECISQEVIKWKDQRVKTRCEAIIGRKHILKLMGGSAGGWRIPRVRH